MKHTISIEIPDGYELNEEQDIRWITDKTNGQIFYNIKKKQTKNFDFYVEEYLRSDECTTNDMLCNHMTPSVINDLRVNLKQNKLEFVPWEVKIGLFKFVCKDKGYRWSSVIWNDKLTNELKEVFQTEYFKAISE